MECVCVSVGYWGCYCVLFVCGVQVLDKAMNVQGGGAFERRSVSGI